MQTDPSINIRLLGAPVIECNGKPVTLKRRKSIALIALIAIERRFHSRDSIMALLWPESDQSHAAALLRTVLWEIRRTPLTRVVEIRGQQIGIPDDAPVSIDIAEFNSLTESHRQASLDGSEKKIFQSIEVAVRAVSLYRGVFMEGFSLPGANTFEEWIACHRDVFHRRYIFLHNALIDGYENAGEIDRAIEYARQLLRIDEMDESVHRCLMRLYATKGERGRAIAQYESCVSILKRELDVAPEDETEILVNDIREGRLTHSAPLQTDRRLSRIPKPVTAFIGREKEISDYSRLLFDPSCRLLTLSGFGGSGKTRLAMELARIASEEKGEQVIFVSLAPIRTALDILFAVADALTLSYTHPGVQTKSTPLPTEELLFTSLIQYLHTRRMIIILDNFEHLLEHGNIITSILTSCPEITIVITSREPTGISGEWIREISGLSCPSGIQGTDDPFAFDSMQLFRELALRIRPDFKPDDSEIEAMLKICRLVDGLPLGIELAVPWLHTMTCTQMAREVESNIDFLEKHYTNLSERHRSIRAIFEQTWSILEPEARSCFRKLSIFRGGFSAEAAQIVAGAPRRALTSLAQRSLIHFNERNRFEILEVIRQFALERLRSVPRESDVIADRHARYYLRIVTESQSSLKGSEQIQALNRIQVDLDNIRTAWKRGVQRGMTEDIDNAAFSLFLFYDIGSRFAEGAAMFAEAITALPIDHEDDSGPLMSILHAAHAWFTRYSDIAASEREFKDSIEVLSESQDPARTAFVLVLSTLHTESVPEDERVHRLEEGLEKYSSIGDAWGEALAKEGLAFTHAHSDPHAAQSFASESLAIRQSIRDTWGISLSRYTYGYVLEFLGNNDTAREQYEESARIRRKLDQDKDGQMGCLLSIARIDYKNGSYNQCEQGLLTVKQTGLENGLYLRVAQSLSGLITLALIRDNPERAWDLSEELFDHITEYDLKRELPGALVLKGNIRFALGEVTSAKHFYEHAYSLDPNSSGALLGLGLLYGDEDIERSYRNFHTILRRGETESSQTEILLKAAVETARCLAESGQPTEAVCLYRFVIHHPRKSLHLEQYAVTRLHKLVEDHSNDNHPDVKPVNEILTLEQILSRIPGSIIREKFN